MADTSISGARVARELDALKRDPAVMAVHLQAYQHQTNDPRRVSKVSKWAVLLHSSNLVVRVERLRPDHSDNTGMGTADFLGPAESNLSHYQTTVSSPCF